MESLLPAPSGGVDTAAWHGGNDYGGPGAWKRPPSRSKKRLRPEVVATSGPLDLTAFFGEKWLFARMSTDADKHHNNQKGNKKTMRRAKKGKAGASQMRLESLSLAMAPSHGAGTSVLPAVGGSLSKLMATKEPKRLHPAASSSCTNSAPDDAFSPLLAFRSGIGPLRDVHLPQPIRPSDGGAWEEKLELTSPTRRNIPDHHLLQEQRQQKQPASTTARTPATAVARGSFKRCHTLVDALPPPASSLLPKRVVAKSPHPQDVSITVWNALRVPSVTTKIAADDKYNAELLDERATLRRLLSRQKQLGEAMRLRRLEACLGTRGDSGARKRGRKQMGRIGRRGWVKNNHQRKKLGVGGGSGVVRRDPIHSHPLLFMAEADVQKVEQDQMRLEDEGATHLLKLEEARRRKQDYAIYYEFALRYGPLTEEEFELAVFPGRRYHAKVSDAFRAIQNWWWGVWPPTLRRRKSSALAMQSLFRGFLQRRRWRAIIRLRTLWGNTRVTAHAFVNWKDVVTKVRKAKALARRLRYRCEAQCFAMFVAHARWKRESRENVLRRRLQKLSDGIRLRVFEGWVSYTETSLAVGRMRRRSVIRPAFELWWGCASESRRRRRLCSASATIVHWLLGWRRRARYVDVRRVCINMQAIARTKITWIQGKRRVKESLMRQAEEAVQALEDLRVRRLMDAEQQRRGRLQAAIKRDASLTQQAASAFLRTSDGKNAVASRLTSMKKKEEEEETSVALVKEPGAASNKTSERRFIARPTTTPEVEARKEVARMFVRRRQALTRHDFNAASPPPLQCPRSDCDATFVTPSHFARHAADVHPEDDPGIAELALVVHAPVGRALLESWIGMMSTTTPPPGESDAHANDDGQQAERLLLTTSENGEAAGDALALWKAIEEWRTAPSSSDDYRQLGRSILDKFASSSTASTKNEKIRYHLICEAGDPLVIASEPSALGSSSSLETTKKQKNASTLRDQRTEYHPSEDTSIINPLGFEEASWRALASLNEVVGQAFLASAPYAGYLDEVKRPMREAVEAEAADIAKRKRAESLAEAQKLREEAFLRVQEAQVDDLAENALSLLLRGGAADAAAINITSFLDDLVDDQAALLSVVIIAERSAFAKIISAVWNEAVEEAAAAAERTARREHREVSPPIVESLSEASSAVVRSRVADQLIDDCVLDLTGPQGELWADARAMAAVADGVGYRVRCNVIEEMLEASVFELQESGEAERLMSDMERRGKEGEAAGNDAARASAGALELAAAAADDDEEEEDEGLSEASSGGAVAATRLALGAAEAGEPSIVDTKDDAAKIADAAAAAAVTDDTSLSIITGGGEVPPSFSHGGEVGVTTGDGGRDNPSRGWEGGETGVTNNDDNGTPTAKMLSTAGGIMSQEDAAVVVQSAWRRKAVYRVVRTLVAQNFIKLYDPAYGAFYWYNQATEESTWEKPAIIDAYFKTNITESLDCY